MPPPQPDADAGTLTQDQLPQQTNADDGNTNQDLDVNPNDQEQPPQQPTNENQHQHQNPGVNPNAHPRPRPNRHNHNRHSPDQPSRMFRSNPLFYRFLYLSTYFTHPLTFLTIASATGLLRKSLTVLPSYSSSSSSSRLSKFPSTMLAGILSSASSHGNFVSGNLNWKTATVVLWWLSFWSWMSRPVLLGSTLVWVFGGWGDDFGEHRGRGHGHEEEEDVGR